MLLTMYSWTNVTRGNYMTSTEYLRAWFMSSTGKVCVYHRHTDITCNYLSCSFNYLNFEMELRTLTVIYLWYYTLLPFSSFRISFVAALLLPSCSARPPPRPLLYTLLASCSSNACPAEWLHITLLFEESRAVSPSFLWDVSSTILW